MKRRVLAMLLLLAMVLSLIPAVGAENASEGAAEHHLLLADDFTTLGSWKRSAPTAGRNALTDQTLVGIKATEENAVPAVAEVNVSAAGTYRVWVHGLYHSPAQSETSWKFNVSVGKTQLEQTFGGYDAGGTYYKWEDGGTVVLAAGKTGISLIDTYRNYARVDGVLLTSQTDTQKLNPTGMNLEKLRQALTGSGAQTPENKMWMILPESFGDMGSWTLRENYSTAFEGKTMAGLEYANPTDAEYGRAKPAIAVLEDMQAGDYKLWVHARTFNYEKANQAWEFQVGVNGTPVNHTFGGGKVSYVNSFCWQDGGTIALTAGENRISLIDSSVNWAKCDAILIAKDLTYTPGSDLSEIKAAAVVPVPQVDLMEDLTIRARDENGKAIYPGANITLVSKRNGVVNLRPQADAGSDDYFYWNFEASSASARTVTFRLDKGSFYGALLSPLGVLCSTDGGKTWVRGGSVSSDLSSFTYSFEAGQTVRFCDVLPYTATDWQQFAARWASNGYVSFGTLCKSNGGADVPMMILGNAEAENFIIYTSRHHCCETIGSYVLEGAIEWILKDAPAEFLKNYCVYVVPMVDFDGVENGDQGKGRAPHDYNRDYLEDDKVLYNAVRAIQNLTNEKLAEGKALAAYIDFHAPGSITTGLGNHLSYPVLEATMTAAIDRFAAILDQIENVDTSVDKLTYDPANKWVGSASADGVSKAWFQEKGAKLSVTVETSFDQTPHAHTPENTRRWGGQISQALQEFLKQEPVQEPVFDAAKAVIADNDTGKALSGTWTASTWRVGYYGNNYLNGAVPNTKHQWTLNVPETAEYELWVHIPSGYQHSASQKETDNLYGDVCQTASYTVSQNGRNSTAYSMSHEKRAGWYCVAEGVSLEAGEAAVTLDTGTFNDKRTAFADAVALQNPAAQSTGKTYLDDGLENVVDNREKEAAEQGEWTLKTNSNAYLGDYVVSSDANASFTWTLTIPEDASYDIACFCADFYNASSVTDQAKYQLVQNGTIVAEKMTTQCLAKGWHPLFSAELKKGTAQITLTNSGSKPLMADAVRMTRTLIAGTTAMTFDNLDANAVHSGAAAQWKKGLKVGTYIGADYELATGENSDSTFFRWPVEVYGAGWWKVEAYLPEGSGQTDLSSAVSYEIVHKNKTDAVTLDHSTKTGWTELGCWEFTGDAESISVIPAKGQAGWAYVDAVRLTYMGQNDPNAEYWIVDNTDEHTICTGTFPSEMTGGWQKPSTWRAGHVGDNYYSLKKGDAEASFTWQFQIPKNGYYAVSINLPDCKTGMDGEGANYQVLSWDTETSVEQLLTKRLSHSAEAGWHRVARVYLKASDDLQNVLKLTGPTKGVCVVDAAKLEYIGAELPVESGSYRIDLNDKQQTILGLGVEIQSESLGSGNTMDETDLQHSVPHDLTEDERQRLYTDMLSGFRYMRLAGGLFYRGTDVEQKHLVPHWNTQDEELAELLRVSGIEGFNFEFWSPTPYFKSSGKYHGGKLKCFGQNWEYAVSKVGQTKYKEEKQKFLEEFADTIIADFQRMRAAGLPVVQFSLQNEPPLSSVYGTYSFCTYGEQEYYETCKVILPRLKEAFPDLFVHAPSWDGQHAGSSQMIKADPATLACVDAWSHHTVGYNADYMLTSRERLNSGTAGLPVINTEFEYQPGNFTGQYDFRFVNTAQAIMNWMVFENSPTWFWLHCLKPLGNEESLGYGLGYWRKSGDTAIYSVGNEVEQQHWDYNYPNFNALRGFLKYMPWDSTRYGVKEDEIRNDQRIMAWKSPEGQLAFAVTNRSEEDFRFDVDTTLSDVVFDGYRLTSSSEEFIPLGEKTGEQISTTLKPYTIEFWVQRENSATMKKAESVTLDKSALTLAVNGTKQLTATVAPDDAANKSVRWTSSDSTVVKVDENGNLTALKEGAATITATAISGSGRIKASCKVTVTSEALEVNKTALKATIDEAETKKKDDYTEDSWAPFASALDEAKKVYDNEDASQETVDNASKALTDAQNALVRVTPTPVDKAELGKAISDAESLVEDETYTVASRKNLKAALDEVKAVYENADATQEDVDAAAAKLNKAIAGLQKKPIIDPSDPIGSILPLLPALDSDTQVTFPFNDVSKADWYYNSVRSAWYNGLIDGVTANEFRPDSTLTVAQAIKLAAALCQMEHEGKVRLTNGETKWYDTYVSYAIANGIIEQSYASYTDTQMNAPVTRGEFVHIFHGAKDGYTAISTVADGAIPDVKTGDKFAAEIYELYRAGILTGSDTKGTFHAASTIKRSEAATILLRMYDSSVRIPITLG